MVLNLFKKSICISFLGHLALLSIFSVSFGTRLIPTQHAGVNFLGSILRQVDTMQQSLARNYSNKAIIVKTSSITALDKLKSSEPSFRIDSFSKPLVQCAFNREKLYPPPALASVSFLPKRRESVVMFYPRLPYHFSLYFKDRETVHIELLFKVVADAKANPIIVKRKISSGNLEADLLSMRYISHYLFVEQSRFAPNTWQNVKIDLSAAND